LVANLKCEPLFLRDEAAPRLQQRADGARRLVEITESEPARRSKTSDSHRRAIAENNKCSQNDVPFATAGSGVRPSSPATSKLAKFSKWTRSNNGPVIGIFWKLDRKKRPISRHLVAFEAELTIQTDRWPSAE
jgi:hypothetical protein